MREYNFNEDGLMILRGVLTHEEADTAAHDLDEFYSKGKGNRVVNLHMTSANILNAITKKAVLQAVDENCFMFPSVYTTLAFQKGTQQEIHRDIPHFLTNGPDILPNSHNNFVGVWYALEDVNADNGPLQYYVGGHKIVDPDGAEIARQLYPRKATLNDAEIDECMKVYQRQVRLECERSGCKIEQAILKKGDVLIWNALLPHGGAPILNHELTRKSIVAHCVPLKTKVFNARQFFNPLFDPKKLPITPLLESSMPSGWHVQKQPEPFFQGEYL
jgi:ectoine hydroxylase-related dioxygenase (phytanoyl-CoA dioxygenase family)